MSRGIFGRSEASEALDKSDSELAVSQRRCEELAQELWKLEKRSQKINQRLLEHTAGILQMTHKGLKKGPKNPAPRASDSTYDDHKFDDRSLYRAGEHLDDFGVHGKGETNAATAMNTEAMQATERRLEELSERMHDMMIQSNPGEFIDPPPQLSAGGGPVNPTATVEAHLAYIKNGMNNIVLHTGDAPTPVAARDVAPEAEGAWKQQLTKINNQVQTIVDRFGLTRSPTLPPPPDASHGEGLEEQLSYLQTGLDGLDSRVDGVLEQKSILTIQIQQQRELNSKSDAERDAYIGDLTEQLNHARRDLEVSEREGNANRDELALVMGQLNAMRQNGSSQEEAKAALVQAEGEVARLQSVVTSLHSEADARVREVKEARDAQDEAEAELKRLQHYIDEVQRDNDSKAEEVSDARDRAEGEVKRLQVVIASLQDDTDAKNEEVREARDHAEDEVKRLQVVIASLQTDTDAKIEEARHHAEDEVKRLQVAIESLRNDADAEIKEAREARDRAEDEVKRLQAIIESLQNDTAVKSKEAVEARDRAEDEVKRLHIVIETLQNDTDRDGDIKEARDRAENEVQRLQGVIETLQNDSDSRSEEVRGARDRAEQEVAQLEAAIQQIRIQSDARIKEADDQRAQSEHNATRLQNEMTELEGEIVRVTTELTMVKAELDGAYGTRAERAAEVSSNPSIQRENDALVTRNIELTEELATLKSQRGGGDLQQRADTLERELRETIDDYEAMTKASIEFEKERERFESFIDSLRDRCEQLETQLAEERISWMNLSSPTSVGRDGTSETTSTMVLKNEFKKMMRDTRNENMKILRVSYIVTFYLFFP
jgi:DNA repair exonuclease SbcCD ATPase subunit